MDPWGPLRTPEGPWTPLRIPEHPLGILRTPHNPWGLMITPEDHWGTLRTNKDAMAPFRYSQKYIRFPLYTLSSHYSNLKHLIGPKSTKKPFEDPIKWSIFYLVIYFIFFCLLFLWPGRIILAKHCYCMILKFWALHPDLDCWLFVQRIHEKKKFGRTLFLMACQPTRRTELGWWSLRALTSQTKVDYRHFLLKNVQENGLLHPFIALIGIEMTFLLYQTLIQPYQYF